jgi:hypothetical protein
MSNSEAKGPVREGSCSISANLEVQGGDGATGDRKGRDGVNPSTTHLHGAHGKMCRRGACPLATLAVAGSHATSRAVKFRLPFALMGSCAPPPRHRCVAPLYHTPLAHPETGSP